MLSELKEFKIIESFSFAKGKISIVHNKGFKDEKKAYEVLNKVLILADKANGEHRSRDNLFRHKETQQFYTNIKQLCLVLKPEKHLTKRTLD
jgi:hypothetical protein